jgi:hypothetical protein
MLMERANRLFEELRARLSVIAKRLADTGLSNGSVSSSTSAYGLERRLPSGFITGRYLLCSAVLPVGSRTGQLSCIVVASVYPDGTVQMCGGYRMVLDNANHGFIGVQSWAGVLGSASQDQAVAELFSSLNARLGMALTSLADWAEKAAAE